MTPNEPTSHTPAAKPKLVIVASPRARRQPGRSLVRLMRDYAEMFRKYEIHTTHNTRQMILGTGMYSPEELPQHRRGGDGGVAELAALIARGESVAAIVLLDPSDPWSEAAENRALKRVCIKRQKRLITTYAAAVRWATYQVQDPDVPFNWAPSNWRPGKQNIEVSGGLKQLSIGERSIALISHDKMKLDMVKFVNNRDRLDLLAEYDRILATGTTGSVLKLLYASDTQERSFTSELIASGSEERVRETFIDLLKKLQITPHDTGLGNLIKMTRDELQVKRHEQFVKKIMPLPSGPDGGDELIADEVLNNRCHAIVFLQDPMTAHPHTEDIRLFERTCQLPSVFAECVSDGVSAERWIEELRQELSATVNASNITQRLRQTWNLQEVLTVDWEDDEDSDDLGRALAHICAGYLNLRLQQIAEEKKEGSEIRVGVACGWGTREVVNELERMKAAGLIEVPKLSRPIVWSPIIGIITAEITDLEAIMIAHSFHAFYGDHEHSRVDSLPCAGFADLSKASPPGGVAELITELSKADIVLTPASPWDEESSLYMNTGLKHEFFPDFNQGVVGTVSGLFLDEKGEEVPSQYSVVGLDREGFINAARTGTVILIAGGNKRRQTALAALRARLASVLITTSQTASWLLSQEESASAGKAASGR